ncbi:MAG TPA: helix-turn-helix transcriptional regulator [Polyangiaceae bacterium]|jgi:transcriptional regulator with XRE-family HTH domain
MAGDEKMAAFWAASRALGFEQRQLAEFTGVSLRTVQRWSGGGSNPGWQDITRLAAAAYRVDRDAARRLAAAVGHTPESLGIVSPAPPAPPALPGPAPQAPAAAAAPFALQCVLVEAIVAAAAEALDVSPRVARPAVLAAMERAKAASLSVDDLLAALRPPPVAASAPPAADAKRGKA